MSEHTSDTSLSLSVSNACCLFVCFKCIVSYVCLLACVQFVSLVCKPSQTCAARSLVRMVYSCSCFKSREREREREGERERERERLTDRQRERQREEGGEVGGGGAER